MGTVFELTTLWGSAPFVRFPYYFVLVRPCSPCGIPHALLSCHASPSGSSVFLTPCVCVLAGMLPGAVDSLVYLLASPFVCPTCIAYVRRGASVQVLRICFCV